MRERMLHCLFTAAYFTAKVALICMPSPICFAAMWMASAVIRTTVPRLIVAPHQRRMVATVPRASKSRFVTMTESSGVDEIVLGLEAIVSEHARKPLDATSLVARLQPQLSSAVALLPLDADSIRRMKVGELRERLRGRGLSTEGLKAEMVERLLRSAETVEQAAAPAAPSYATARYPPALQAKLDAVMQERRGPQSGIFCDGSCNPNPGPGGWGVVAVRDAAVLWSDRGSDSRTTNNRMELHAIIEALRQTSPDEAVTIYSDSRLCVQTLNEWAASWERRGWTRSGGQTPENLDLVKEAFGLARARPKVEIRWLKGHAGSTWNEFADRLAGWRGDGQ